MENTKFLTIKKEVYINIELFKCRPDNCIIAKIDGLGEFVQLDDLMGRTAFIIADRMTYSTDEDCEVEDYRISIITKGTKVAFCQLSILRNLFKNKPLISIGNYCGAAVVYLEFIFEKD